MHSVFEFAIFEPESCPSKWLPLPGEMHYKTIAKSGIKIHFFHGNGAHGIWNSSVCGNRIASLLLDRRHMTLAFDAQT